MRIPSWTSAMVYFLRGYSQLSTLLAIASFGSTISNTFILFFLWSKSFIFALVAALGMATIIITIFYGWWDMRYRDQKKNTPYRRQIRIDSWNNPLVQMQIRTNIIMLEGLGKDASIWKGWLNPEFDAKEA